MITSSTHVLQTSLPAILRLLAALGLSISPTAHAADPPGSLVLDPSLIALNSPAGRDLLAHSQYQASFIPLCQYFTTQDTLTYCGPATCTMVLNALPIERPVHFAKDARSYTLFTQRNFFSAEVSRVATPELVKQQGMRLDQLAGALKTYPIDVQLGYAEECSIDRFKDTARKTLASDDGYLIVNFARRVIRQEGAGHISPVAAYHEDARADRDRLLILDVSRYKYGPVWVRTDRLWSAMLAHDFDREAHYDKSRGFIVVQARKPANHARPEPGAKVHAPSPPRS